MIISTKTIVEHPDQSVMQAWMRDMSESWDKSNFKIGRSAFTALYNGGKGVASVDSNGHLIGICSYQILDTNLLRNIPIQSKEFLKIAEAVQSQSQMIKILFLGGMGRGGGREIIQWFQNKDIVLILSSAPDAVSFYQKFGFVKFPGGGEPMMIYVPPSLLPKKSNVIIAIRGAIQTLSIIKSIIDNALDYPYYDEDNPFSRSQVLEDIEYIQHPGLFDKDPGVLKMIGQSLHDQTIDLLLKVWNMDKNPKLHTDDYLQSILKEIIIVINQLMKYT